jgi:AbrB family looped-hinge helix DNA binding protein
MTITIDKLGRMVLPKSFRDQFHIHPGDSLQAEIQGGSIVLSPLQNEGGLVRKKGLLVHHGTETIDLDLLSFMQRERDQHLTHRAKGS